MARSINFDAIIEEARGEPVIVTFAGKELTLPGDLPMQFVDYLVDSDPRSALAFLFDDEEIGTEIYRTVGRDAVNKFVEAVLALYTPPSVEGGDSGESSASSPSSTNGGESSRPISDASTTARSRKPVTAVRDSA